METADPLVSLSSPKLSERCAAARDLSRIGTLDVIPRLVRLAQADPSPAVRLTCATAAADILSRHRVGPRRDELNLERRRSFLALFRGIDPGVNAGLFLMLACLGLPETFHHMAAGLRDPRGAVRVGAAIGLLRLCMSAEAEQDTELEGRVVALLGDRRLKPDALADVARVCSAVGYRTAIPSLHSLDLPGTHGEAVATALDVLQAGLVPLRGAWVSDGTDAGEVNPTPALPPQTLAFGELGVVEAVEDGWRLLADVDAAAVRRMYVRRVGERESEPAVQLGGRTYFRLPTAELCDLIDRCARAEQFDGDALPAYDTGAQEDRVAASALQDGLVEGAASLRAKGILLARAGRATEALAAMEAASLAKKPPADIWFLMGELLHALGREEEARGAWEAFLRKEKRRKAPFVERAAARLGV